MQKESDDESDETHLGFTPKFLHVRLMVLHFSKEFLWDRSEKGANSLLIFHDSNAKFIKFGLIVNHLV